MAVDRGWNWHIWELHPVTKKPFKYVGFMNDEVAAMEWIKKNGKEHYKVLNFGPNALAKGSQTHSDSKTKKKVVKHSPSKVQEEMAKARAESIRKDRERVVQREKKNAKRAEQERKNQEAMKGIRDDAAGLLVKHKEDEQADLDAGINR